ncbi:flagellin [Sporolactobacillus sp. STSJ-5]|uniref:flagellin N-terminal helical domain-containing protein n=1 Tax=Sporolactobacillus sp. STSJ-5 TaxID=2965076 RepID=UPI002107F81E|nr:flagellin [Sporolactobacillus sp. STSJ-5]MCQ2011626.1 flagellin [Sporolactobacillus sp. STSJ-5]
MIINHNIASLNTLNQLSKNETATQKSLAKLSSGLRINSAADDAAGLAISEKMKAQINGLDQAKRNSQDGTSLIQTAEGALSETTSILQRMRELAVQAGNTTNTTDDVNQINTELQNLYSEVDRISDVTAFNTQNLLGGTFTGTLQIGANSNEILSFGISDMGVDALFTGFATGSITSLSADNASASVAISAIDLAITAVSKQRDNLGALQNRLEHTINNLSTSSQNLTDAESRITDVDMASEMANFTKNNILNQAAQAMLAQSNQLPQGVLQLLR